MVVEGELPPGVTAKDVTLAIIGRLGTGGGIGSVIEYRGSAIRALSMEGRMTLCNMSIEAGARAGMIAPDDTTFAYLEGRRHAPTGQGVGRRARGLATLVTDDGATFDKTVELDAPASSPRSRGEPTPARSSPLSGRIPSPESFADPVAARRRRARARVHGPDREHADDATSPSTPCSSAAARTPASKTCAPLPRCSRASTSPTACARSSCRVRTR